MKQANAILCGDIHLRETTPICRTDDFERAQWAKLDFISNLQQKHNCPVLCSGDLFDNWKPSPYLLSKTIQSLPDKFYSVAGNHDEPQHNVELINKSGIFTLMLSGKLQLLMGAFNYVDKYQLFNIFGASWGELPKKEIGPSKKVNILVWHRMTYKKELPFPGCTESNAKTLLHNYPQYNLILTGDNHQPFIEEYKGRLLVNPGSMMRQTADQIDYKPAVWLWYADTNTVEPVYLPIEKNVITREHLKSVEERENRIHAFVSALNKDGMDYISFEKNLERCFQQNDITEPVKEIIYQMLEP